MIKWLFAWSHLFMHYDKICHFLKKECHLINLNYDAFWGFHRGCFS